MVKWLLPAFLFVVFVELTMSALWAASLLGVPEHGSLVAGPLHLAYRPEHFLALIAVGVWAGRLGGSARWVFPVSFAAGMMLGFLVGASQPVPKVNVHIHLAVVVATVALVTAAALALPLLSLEATSTLISLGMCQGYVDGAAAGTEALLSDLSFFLTAAALLGLGVGLGKSRAL